MSIKEILFLTLTAAWVAGCSDPNIPSIPAPNTDCTLDGGGFPMTQAMSDLCCDKVNHVFKVDPATGKPPVGCPTSASTSVEKNEGTLALEILRSAARTLNSATELSGIGTGVIAGGDVTLAATAGNNFVELPEQKLDTPKLNLNRKLTDAEEATLQRIGGSGGSALKADTGAFKKLDGNPEPEEEAEDGYSSRFGASLGATTTSGDKKAGGTTATRTSFGSEVTDLSDSAGTSPSGADESDLTARSLAGFSAPEDYFQRPDTRVEKSLFYRITQVHQRNLLQWARKSIKP